MRFTFFNRASDLLGLIWQYDYVRVSRRQRTLITVLPSLV